MKLSEIDEGVRKARQQTITREERMEFLKNNPDAYRRYSRAIANGQPDPLSEQPTQPVAKSKSRIQLEHDAVMSEIESATSSIMKASQVNKTQAYAELFKRQPEFYQKYRRVSSEYIGAVPLGEQEPEESPVIEKKLIGSDAEREVSREIEAKAQGVMKSENISDPIAARLIVFERDPQLLKRWRLVSR